MNTVHGNSNSFCCEVIILFFHFKVPFALQLILKMKKNLLLNSSQVITKYNRNSAIQSNKVDQRGTLTWLLQPGVSGIFSVFWIFPENWKNSLTNRINNLQKVVPITRNPLNSPLTAWSPTDTYQFMLSARHMQCTWIDTV